MKQVTPEPKDGKVFAEFTSTPKGIHARVSFIDQFGIERARFIGPNESDFAFKVIASVFDGTAKIMPPEQKVENAYEKAANQ